MITEVNFKCIKHAIFIKCKKLGTRLKLDTVLLIFLLIIIMSLQLFQIHVYLIHEQMGPDVYDRGIFKMNTIECLLI